MREIVNTHNRGIYLYTCTQYYIIYYIIINTNTPLDERDERKSRSRRGNTSFFPPAIPVRKTAPRHPRDDGVRPPRQAPHIRRPGRPLSRRRPALDKPGLRRRTEHAHALHSLPYAHLDDDGDDDYTTATATATCLATAAVCCFRGRVRTARRLYNILSYVKYA